MFSASSFSLLPSLFLSLTNIEQRIWISALDAAEVTQKGFRVVHSPSDYFYLVRPSSFLMFVGLVLMRTEGLRWWRLARGISKRSLYVPIPSHPSPKIPTNTKTAWCDPFKTWQRIYSFNPLSNITDANRNLVLGGQSLLWSEQAGPENLDPIVWPRAAGVAEVFWTGETLPDGTDRLGREALDGALGRIHDIR